MKTLKLLGGLLLSCASLSAFACIYPALPEIPSEEKIEEQGVLLIKADTLKYLAGMESYVSCIQQEYEAAVSAGSPSLHLSLLATRNNVAVAEVEFIRDVYEARIGAIEELADVGAVNCIRGGPNVSARMVDSESILFYALDGVYRNILEQRCPSSVLTHSNISFGGVDASRFGQGFCRNQRIEVDGGTCRLGQFYPISESEAEALLRQ